MPSAGTRSHVNECFGLVPTTAAAAAAAPSTFGFGRRGVHTTVIIPVRVTNAQ